MEKSFRLASLLPLCLVLQGACSTSSPGSDNSGSAGAATVGGAGTATGTGSGGDGNTTGGGAAVASGGQGGASVGGSEQGGAPGVGGAAVSTDGGPSGDASGDNGDTKPVRPLMVTAPAGQHVHMDLPNSVGLDTRAPKMMGKLIVDLGVDSGGYWAYAGKRGFHVFGVSFFHCPSIDDWTKGRDYNGDCRANSFDGMKHGDQANVDVAGSITGKIQSGLKTLQTKYPEEDWGYFLNQDGTVRWSDVGFEGISHGAQTASRIGHLVRIYRAVSRSGPRDNTCGKGVAAGDFDPNMLPYDAACPDMTIATWLDEKAPTPMDRFYGFVGKQDVQYGDIMFGMQRMGYLGMPVNISTTAAPYNGTHRFYANEGHTGFDTHLEALDIAFGVPDENKNPKF